MGFDKGYNARRTDRRLVIKGSIPTNRRASILLEEPEVPGEPISIRISPGNPRSS